MKYLIFAIIIALSSLQAFGQARPGIYPWSIKIKVVDDSGQPVDAAKVDVGYAGDKQIEGLTDTNGIFATSKIDRSWELGVQIQKHGYYSAFFEHDLYLPGQFDDQKVTLSRNGIFSIVLKKIVKPIPMYAKSLNTYVPQLDRPIGYDLELGDWVSPCGKGTNADILFAGHFDRYTNGESDFTLVVTFPNSGDGIQEFKMPDSAKGNELRSAQEAPENNYHSKWVQTDNRTPGKPIETNRDPNRNYYFRVRTKIDDRGNIVRAQYGKIYGDFMEFKYYLNPTPNDRDVEFDPKHNLLTNLKFDEGVSQP